jgi:hypothetical protein
MKKVAKLNSSSNQAKRNKESSKRKKKQEKTKKNQRKTKEELKNKHAKPLKHTSVLVQTL